MARGGKALQEFLNLSLTDKQKEIIVNQLQTDNRSIQPGDMFIACPGVSVDARQFVRDAADRGAVAVLAEKAVSDEQKQWLQTENAPVIEVSGLRAQVGVIAAGFYGHPSRQLDVVAVTGTNGKTSVSQLIAQAQNMIEGPAAVMGTLGNGPLGQLLSTVNTTPGPVDVQRLFNDFVSAGIRAVALEASSHGLEQYRLDGTCIRTAVLTNISRDHLDYHGTMEAYQQAKERLVIWPELRELVWNADDSRVAEMAAKAPEDVRRISYSMSGNKADLMADNISYTEQGLAFDLQYKGKSVAITSGLIGGFNLSNLLAVIGVLILRDCSLKQIAKLVPGLQPIQGRMEMVSLKKGGESFPTVLVDYAHTPDALMHALQAVRTHCQGQLWCVFGCGGDRDRGKRPLMGEMVARYADRIVLTSDNPRTEKLEDIFTDIEAGFPETTDYFVKKDRKEAIVEAVMDAEARDWILIAGKGHEDYQEVNGERTDFSDVKVAKKALKKRRQDTGSSCT